MTQERNALAWLALIGSLALCLPCACLSALIAAMGIGMLTVPGIDTTSTVAENAFFTGLFALVMISALIPGIGLFVWGARTLLKSPAGPSATGQGM